jgi:predicted RNA binding protein YcfA (HicA-like mRNA interferase family)
VTPALPVVSGKKAIRVLEKSGFTRVSQKGSHVKLRSDEGLTVIVPLHRDLARGTLASILRQAGLTVDDVIELL